MSTIHDADGKGIGASNPLATKVIESAIMQPVDIQGRYQQTIQTHNAVSIPNASGSNSAWIDCNGFDKVAVTILNNASTASYADFTWSNDGVTLHGVDYLVVPVASQANRAGITDVKARYLRIYVANNDTIAHVMSAWAYLKA